MRKKKHRPQEHARGVLHVARPLPICSEARMALSNPPSGRYRPCPLLRDLAGANTAGQALELGHRGRKHVMRMAGRGQRVADRPNIGPTPPICHISHWITVSRQDIRKRPFEPGMGRRSTGN